MDGDNADGVGDDAEDLGDGDGGAGAGQPSAGRNALEWGVVIVGALVVALLVRAFVLESFFIPSGSMEPTLRGGNGIPEDRVLVDKVTYRLREPARGDVVVFHSPPPFEVPGATELIKRVVGLPGDEIVFDSGRVRVNGELLDEPYLGPDAPTFSFEDGHHYGHSCAPTDPCKVPDDHLWVMGDNRMASEDSRRLGPVPRDLVVGRAFVVVWPLDRLSGL